MINNRQNGRNNRRGRGGPRPMGGGGQGPRPDSGNRMDNRQRGNAHQLHEKYKNLARDAQTQGDRVTAEYYLQFADHYFRVLGEHRARQEEHRERQEEYRERQQRHQDARYDDGGDDDREDSGYGDEDATAPISISGLPPAISGNRAPEAEDDGEPEDQVQEERQDRGRGRGRRPRIQAEEAAEPQVIRPKRAEVQVEEAKPARARRTPRARTENGGSETLQFELGPIEAPADEEQGAAKPRRRVRRARQDDAETAA